MSWNTWILRGGIAGITLMAALAIANTGNAQEGEKRTYKPGEAAVFNHEAHGEHFDMKKCSDCHKNAESERPAPTTKSHAPCLASGCHIDQFMAVGPRTERENPELFQQAAAFCLSCHKNKEGRPPKRFARPKADGMFQHPERSEYHVEMNHFEHTKRTACTTCHIVDRATFELEATGPAHKQCSTCHEDEEKQPMSACGGCHESPGAAQYFTKTRKGSEVRVCTGDATKDHNNPPCFKHERQEHRFTKNDEPLECTACHNMFEKKNYKGSSYESIADVKAAPMIDSNSEIAHKKCGASGCHRSEVDDSSGRGKCKKCHSDKTISLWD